MRRTHLIGVIVGALVLAVASIAHAKNEKIPITTSSKEARELYEKGRDLNEKLRGTDARKLFEQAIAKDKSFAMGYVGLANTAGTTKEFFDALAKALEASKGASAAEQLVIRGLDAGARGDLAAQREAYTKLVTQFPDDERAQMLLGAHYFGQQDYPNAIKAFERAIAIDAKFTAPYNQLGYAYRFTDHYAEAKKTFEKYIQLIPTDPNPYDSYGELLMKMGKFDESIVSYQKALAIDANFIASYVGIGNNQMFLGKYGDARATFGKLAAHARSEGERRQALVWTAVAYCHESAWDKALAEIDKMSALATKQNDLGQLANDHNFAGNTLLEAGRADAAAARFEAQVAVVDKSNLPGDVKETIKRNNLYDLARVALAKQDLATAKQRATAYGKQVVVKAIPFEVRQHHELLGMIAIADKNWKTAVAELAQGNQLDPRVLYLAAVALEGSGDKPAAVAMAKRAADFNALALNLGYVRGKAKKLAGT